MLFANLLITLVLSGCFWFVSDAVLCMLEPMRRVLASIRAAAKAITSRSRSLQTIRAIPVEQEIKEELREKLGLLTNEEVAQVIAVTEHTLSVWRSAGKGPKFVRLGRNVFYRLADVQAWVDANVVTAEAADA